MSDYIPKVGEDFEYSVFGKIWEWQSCIAVTKSLVIGENINGEETPFRINSNKFRPIISARDKAIDEMLLLDIYPDSEARGGMMSRREFCGKLLDAGYRKIKPLSRNDFIDMCIADVSLTNTYSRLIKLGHIVNE